MKKTAFLSLLILSSSFHNAPAMKIPVTTFMLLWTMAGSEVVKKEECFKLRGLGTPDIARGAPYSLTNKFKDEDVKHSLTYSRWVVPLWAQNIFPDSFDFRAYFETKENTKKGLTGYSCYFWKKTSDKYKDDCNKHILCLGADGNHLTECPIGRAEDSFENSSLFNLMENWCFRNKTFFPVNSDICLAKDGWMEIKKGEWVPSLQVSFWVTQKKFDQAIKKCQREAKGKKIKNNQVALRHYPRASKGKNLRSKKFNSGR